MSQKNVDKMATMVYFVDKMVVMLQEEHGKNGDYGMKNRT